MAEENTRTREKGLSPLKRMRQNEKRRIRNRAAKSRLKTIGKKLDTAIVEKKDKSEIMEYFKEYASYADNIAGKGIIHKNNAARKKSNMMKKINQLFAASS